MVYTGSMSLSKAARYVLASQLSLYAYLLICFLLLPKFLLQSNEGGVSNYGVHALTVVPYSLAFWLSGLLLLAAGYSVNRRPAARTLRRVLLLLGVLTLLVLLTTYPYKLNRVFDDLHIWAAVLLFVTEMLVGIWLVGQQRRSFLALALFTVQLAGFVLSGLTLFGYLHILFLAQLINNVSFSALLVYGVSRAKT